MTSQTAKLNNSQLGIYLECIQKPNSKKYNIPFEYAFSSNQINSERLLQALNRVLAHYAAFSGYVNFANPEPCIEFLPNPPVAELHRVSEAEYAEIRTNLVHPFAYDKNYITSAAVYETAEHVYILLHIHHFFIDGTSTLIFENALRLAYDGKQIPPESQSLGDYAAWEESMLQSEQAANNHAYFENYLNGVEADSTPLADVDDESLGELESIYEHPLTDGCTEIISFAKDHGVTENHVMIAAFSYALAKLNAQDEALFRTIQAGRHGKDLNNTLGMFVKTFPFYAKIDENQTVSTYLEAIRSNYIETLKHSETSLIDIFPKIPSISFAYQGNILSDTEVGGTLMHKTYLEIGEAIFDITVMVHKRESGYYTQFYYRSSKYSQDYIQAIAEFFAHVLNQMIRCDTLREISFMTPDSRSFIDRFNNTEYDYDKSQTVCDLLIDKVQKNPDALAVFFGNTKWSYSEFDTLTQKLATFINRKGIGRNEFVSVLIHRNQFMPLTAWGVVRSGAAYQPLDPTYPKERLNFMVKDCGARLLIADRDLRGLLDEYEGEVLYTDEITNLPFERLSVQIQPTDALVIIYTSGTTGSPKGCVLENRNIVSFYHAHKQIMALDEHAHVATYASFGFDAGIMDMFTTMMAGATLYIIPDEIRLDTSQMDRFFIENNITNGFMTTQVGRMFAEQTKCKTLKKFLVGGEKLVPFTPPTDFEFVNGYGPSETIAYVCSHVVRNDSVIQPIGKPGANTKLYVCDKLGRLLPPGVCGELCISGGQVGRGYLNRPDKTAQSFINNPFSSQPGYERLYKTGDIVCLLPRGELSFVGRRDGQVKIRGFRVELTEVEQVIRSHNKIKNATVQAYDTSTGSKYLAAFIVSDEPINREEISAFIAKRKPTYMVPQVIMQIDSIPLNANGKVDKRKLPQPKMKVGKADAPENATQQKIYDLTVKAMENADFGIHTNLFQAGLSSFGSIMLIVELSRAFDMPFQITDLKENDTIEKLEKFILSNHKTESFDVFEDYPLCKTQEGIYIECLNHPETTTYNIPFLLKIDNKINIDRLKKAIANAIAAHPYIKTVLFTNSDGNVRQRRMDDAPFSEEDIPTIEVKNIRDIEQDLVKPFKMINSRLFRIEIIRAESLYLFIDIHHIISDGTALAVFANDITRAYRGEKLEKERFSGFEVALSEQNKRENGKTVRAKAYYEKLLSGFDTDFLPKRDIPFGNGLSNGIHIRSCADSLHKDILAYAQKNNLPLNGIFCAAFGYMLALYNAADYSEFATVYNGRNDSRTANTFSMLVKTFPVLVKAQDTTPAKLAAEISAQLTDSMANDLYSFAEIKREIGANADVIFIYQGSRFTFETFCDASSQLISLETTGIKSPLTFQVIDQQGIFHFQLDYDASRYSAAFIESFADSFETMLKGFITRDSLSEIELLSPKAAAKMDVFNQTEDPYDFDKTVVDIYHEKAVLYQDHLAVVCGNRFITYAELSKLTAKVASYVASKGIGTDQFVSILISRNEYMAITALGVIEAGAAYQPIDPAYPQERIDFMLADSQSRLMILDRNLQHLIPNYSGELLFTDEIENLPDGSAIPTKITPDSALIIMYTSGTTGTPKGCILEHRSITCFCNGHIKNLGLTPESRLANYAGFGFDAGLQDIAACAMSGAALYIIPDEIRLDLDQTEKFFCRNEITHGFMTTQVGRMFLLNTKCKTLRCFEIGGEKLLPFIPPKDITVLNGYGPSETMAYVCSYKLKDDSEFQPIGPAVRNMKLYIVDRYGHRLPYCACGELCISGRQLGRGYYQRPEKTEEVFVKNPFCTEDGYERMYRTGDVIRMLPDGNYDFIGRRDGQVKIRGFRVELSEVDQIIRRYPRVKDVTVQAFDEPNGGKFIAAYIVSDSPIEEVLLKSFITMNKPAYMVPAVIMQIDKIPLNANGKVDKRALPKPVRQAKKAGIEPANEVEQSICDIFKSVLEIEKVYADDDFFEIGGSSITAVQVTVKCDIAGYSVVYKNLFENPTPRKLADFILRGKGDKDIFAPQGKEKEKYNYSALDYNVIENLREIRNDGVGDVLLTGSTGFLGSHLLKELINETDGHVICLVRGKDGLNAQQRFEMMMVYYFDEWYTDSNIAERVTVIEGDLNDPDIAQKLENLHFDTIINSAANVRHFAAGNSLLGDNYTGVENLISLAEKTGARLIQISSLSVCGESVNGNIPQGFFFRENNLNIGQSLENKYIYSKYLAEQAVIDATSRGRIKGKIIRLGNLMARNEDGEFQINANSNAFLKQFIAYRKLGCYPIDMMDAKLEFSPIDVTARAIRLLSGTPDRFTVFHAKNCHEIHYGYFLMALNRKGFGVDIVENDEFEARFKKALNEEKDLSALTGFIAYMNKTNASPTDTANYTANTNKENLRNTRTRISSGTDFTVKALYRLGFAWPLISSEYFDRMVDCLSDSAFFWE